MSGGSWHADALCANRPDLDPVFFPERGGNARVNKEAKEFCGNCPVRLGCLTAALDEEKGLPVSARFGIRGGMTPLERAQLADPKARARRVLTKRPAACLECKRKLRLRTEPADGRARYAARGLCQNCYQRAHKKVGAA